MSRRCLLFTYGTLQPGSASAPKSLGCAWPDRLRGRLFDLGEYPGATDLEAADTWITGQTVEIDEAELPALDEFEEVALGLFARRLVTTEGGRVAWAYEFCGAVPIGSAPLKQWHRPEASRSNP